ncbi:hypothetical protein CSPAE12_08587 [Colletotrichum incanum]|nr:hypothetical protein CSPAE12_08587 [Colletotrichum incanum]
MYRFFEQILVLGIVIVVVVTVCQVLTVVVDFGHVEQGQIRFPFHSKVVFNIAVVEYDDTPLSRLAGPFLQCGLERKASKNVAQVPRAMRVHNPNLNAAKGHLLPFRFQSQQTSQVNHATDAKANNNSSTASLGLHHWLDQVSASAIEVSIAGDGLYLMGNIVVLQ